MNNERLEKWFRFLQEESNKQDGLLCFYEIEKSQEVARCCEILSENLEAFLANDLKDEKVGNEAPDLIE
jgi:hypothetical protein